MADQLPGAVRQSLNHLPEKIEIQGSRGRHSDAAIGRAESGFFDRSQKRVAECPQQRNFGRANCQLLVRANCGEGKSSGGLEWIPDSANTRLTGSLKERFKNRG